MRLLGGEPPSGGVRAAPVRSRPPERADYLDRRARGLRPRRAPTVRPTAPFGAPVAGGSGDIVGFVRADGLVRVAPDIAELPPAPSFASIC